MIPAMCNLSNTTISLISETDIFMWPAESVLGKRTAEENRVQGQKLEVSLVLNYAEQAGGIQKKGKKEEARQDRTEKDKLKGNTNNVYGRKKAAIGHGASGQLQDQMYGLVRDNELHMLELSRGWRDLDNP
jgi:hypothetical protein